MGWRIFICVVFVIICSNENGFANCTANYVPYAIMPRTLHPSVRDPSLHHAGSPTCEQPLIQDNIKDIITKCTPRGKVQFPASEATCVTCGRDLLYRCWAENGQNMWLPMNETLNTCDCLAPPNKTIVCPNKTKTVDYKAKEGETLECHCRNNCRKISLQCHPFGRWKFVDVLGSNYCDVNIYNYEEGSLNTFYNNKKFSFNCSNGHLDETKSDVKCTDGEMRGRKPTCQSRGSTTQSPDKDLPIELSCFHNFTTVAISDGTQMNCTCNSNCKNVTIQFGSNNSWYYTHDTAICGGVQMPDNQIMLNVPTISFDFASTCDYINNTEKNCTPNTKLEFTCVSSKSYRQGKEINPPEVIVVCPNQTQDNLPKNPNATLNCTCKNKKRNVTIVYTTSGWIFSSISKTCGNTITGVVATSTSSTTRTTTTRITTTRTTTTRTTTPPQTTVPSPAVLATSNTTDNFSGPTFRSNITLIIVISLLVLTVFILLVFVLYRRCQQPPVTTADSSVVHNPAFQMAAPPNEDEDPYYDYPEFNFRPSNTDERQNRPEEMPMYDYPELNVRPENKGPKLPLNRPEQPPLYDYPELNVRPDNDGPVLPPNRSQEVPMYDYAELNQRPVTEDQDYDYPVLSPRLERPEQDEYPVLKPRPEYVTENDMYMPPEQFVRQANNVLGNKDVDNDMYMPANIP